MKNVVLILSAVLCTQAAFALSDDQVVPSYPVPAGDVRIDALQEIELTEQTVLTAYVEKRESKASVYGMGDTEAQVSCNLTASDVALSNFNVIKNERVGGPGSRLYISPAKAISLKFKTSLQGVEARDSSCNGEPELCENSSYYVYRTQIFATDKTGNVWSLNCVAPFSRPVLASDVKINGLQIK